MKKELKSWKTVLKRAAKNILPVNIVRKLIAVRKRMYIRQMELEVKKPYEKGAFPIGVNLIGCFRLKTGLGQGCRLTAAAFHDCGFPVAMRDFSLSAEYGGPTEYDGLLREQSPYAINVFFINMHEYAQAFLKIGRNQWDRHYNIVYWNWEAEQFPKEWIPLFKQIDEIWTASEYTSKAIRTVTDKPVVTIGYSVPVPKCSNVDRSFFGLPDDVFLYLILFDNNSYSKRKNPEAAIEAFKKAFPEDCKDVGLVVKITAPDWKLLHRLRESLKGYQVWFLQELYSREDLNALIKLCNVYVSLHRAEGFGMVLAEAMLLGIPTVATAYSSNIEFQTDESACLVNFRKAPLEKDLWPYKKGYQWAEADTDDAAKLMRRLKEDTIFWSKISENGKHKAEEEFEMKKIQGRILERYNNIVSK